MKILTIPYSIIESTYYVYEKQSYGQFWPWQTLAVKSTSQVRKHTLTDSHGAPYQLISTKPNLSFSRTLLFKDLKIK